MPLDIDAIQVALRGERLDGWLLYDFHGSNPIASRLVGLAGNGKMATRRWYYLIPATGTPRGLVHAIERRNLDAVPGEKVTYAGRQELEDGLRALLAGCRRVAMEYSPECAIPYISRVDAGTVDLVRHLNVEVASSGDLVQRFEAVWDARALAAHRAASERLYAIKDRAFDAIARATRDGEELTEYGLQQRMVSWFAQSGLVSDSPPVVAAQEHSAHPHYLPTAANRRVIQPNDVVLLDLWAKLDEPGAVFADITWVGYVGPHPPEAVREAFRVVCEARDEAVRVVQEAVRERRELRGWQIDRAARAVIEGAGFGSRILHRTGHSLGEQVHGNGVHLDDYETHDDRRVLPGTGFTIEPGLYGDEFGVRTEINMYAGAQDATVTGPRQSNVVTLM